MCQEVAPPTVLNYSIHILRKAKSLQNALVLNTLYMLSLGSFWPQSITFARQCKCIKILGCFACKRNPLIWSS